MIFLISMRRCAGLVVLASLSSVAAACGSGGAETGDAGDSLPPPPVDARVSDGGSPDGSPVDGTPGDVGPTDAGPDATPPDAGPPFDLDTFATEHLRAQCSAMYGCDVFGVFKDVDECVEHYDGFADGEQAKYVRRLEVGLGHGTIRADVGWVDACLADLASEQCPGAFSSEACDRMFVGSVEEGGACLFDEECAAFGGTCLRSDCEDACCLGTCQAPAGLGESCETRACEPGAHCVTDPDMGVKHCQSGELGATCTGDYTCDGALWCRQGLCVNDVAPDYPCERDGQCPNNTLCVGESAPGNSMGVCSRVNQPGDACDDYCYGGLYCDVPNFGEVGVCTSLPERGEDCEPTLGRCASILLYCNASFRCDDVSELDEACITGFCAPGLICSSELTGMPSGTCVEPLPPGETCTRDGHCGSYVCAGAPGDKTCTPWTDCRDQTDGFYGLAPLRSQ